MHNLERVVRYFKVKPKRSEMKLGVGRSCPSRTPSGPKTKCGAGHYRDTKKSKRSSGQGLEVVVHDPETEPK
jgi:hypothetical protein